MTGGPCSGKTTSICYLCEKLLDRGWMPLVVPEVATMYMGPGAINLAEIRQSNRKLYLEIEERMLLTQIAMEKEFLAMASSFSKYGHKVVILLDRGIKDIRAYVSGNDFEKIARKNGLDLKLYAATNYDLIIHMVTAACGAERFYTQSNNPARIENSLELAREADERTMKAWMETPDHFRWVPNIDNRRGNKIDFRSKQKIVKNWIWRQLGIPESIEMERRFLLLDKPDFKSDCFKNSVQAEIEQVYLVSSDPTVTLRLRKRTQCGISVYYETKKVARGLGEHYETERFITAKEYRDFLPLRDTTRQMVAKKRILFVSDGYLWELDIFQKPQYAFGMMILEVELLDISAKIKIPDCIGSVKEVTGDCSSSRFTAC